MIWIGELNKEKLVNFALAFKGFIVLFSLKLVFPKIAVYHGKMRIHR